MAPDLATATSGFQYPPHNRSWGPGASSMHCCCHAGRDGHEHRGRGLISRPTASLLQLGGNQAITAQGARVLFTYSVTSSYLLVTKESLVTNTCHLEMWITILPCTRDSQFSKTEHYQCIQHKLVKNTATIRTFYVPGTTKSLTETLIKSSLKPF